MKIPASFAALLLLVLSLSVMAADVAITKDEASSIKTYDLAEVADRGPTLNGSLIRVKFNYRGRDLDQNKCSIGLYNATNPAKIKTAVVPAAIPPEGMNWFLKISTDQYSRQQVVVYGRVISETPETPRHIQLLGREMKTDIKGARILW